METEFLNLRKILYIIALLIFAFSTYIVFKSVLFSEPNKNTDIKKDSNTGVAFNPPVVGEISQSGVVGLYSSTGDQTLYSLNDSQGVAKYILKSENIDLSLSSGSTVEILGRINGRLDGIAIIEVSTVKYK